MTKKKIEQIAKELGWAVEWSGDKFVIFSRYSSYGQDFNVEICYEKINDIPDELEQYYDSFDVSYEAYIWLGDDGHGKNGAPYEMIDVYNDMKECEEKIHELYQELKA